MKKFNFYSKILAAGLCMAMTLGGVAGFKSDKVKAQEPFATAPLMEKTDVAAKVADAVVKEVNEATQDAVEFTTMWGDWDMDGTVTLQDARNVLKASLNLIEADSVHRYMFGVYEETGITLENAQNTLSIALNLSQGNTIKRTRPEVVYETIRERSSEDNYSWSDLFETREKLQKWAVDNRLPEISQAAASISEEQLKDRWLVVVSTPVYTKDINDVQIKEIYTELCDHDVHSQDNYKMPPNMLAVMEENASVLDGENRAYISINLLPKYEEAWYAMIQCDKTLTGSQKATVHRHTAPKIWERTSPDTIVLRSGKDGVSYRDALLKDIKTMPIPDDHPEANASDEMLLSKYYPEELLAELTKDESFYEKYTQIVYRVNEVYNPERQMLSWTSDGENANIYLKTENWISHIENPTGANGDTYFVVTIENSLLQGKAPVLHFEKNTVYTDFEPEQEQFSFEGYGGDIETTGCSNDGQRQELLAGLEELLSRRVEKMEKQRLFDAIEAVDLEKKDVIVAFTKTRYFNHIHSDDYYTYLNPKKLYLELKGTWLYDRYEQGEELKSIRMVITVCTVEKGRLGNLIDSMQRCPLNYLATYD